jgi:hypothetical protein
LPNFSSSGRAASGAPLNNALESKSMKGWQRVLVLVVVLILINGATWVVVVENQHRGLYPIDGDSVGIPIISTLIASSLVLPLLVFIGFLPGSNFVSRLCIRGLAWTVGVSIVLLVLYFGAAVFAVGGASYWSIPRSRFNRPLLCDVMFGALPVFCFGCEAIAL